MHERVVFPVRGAPVDDVFRIGAEQPAEIVLELRDAFARRIDLDDADRAVRALHEVEAQQVVVEDPRMDRLRRLGHLREARMPEPEEGASALRVLPVSLPVVVVGELAQAPVAIHAHAKPALHHIVNDGVRHAHAEHGAADDDLAVPRAAHRHHADRVDRGGVELRRERALLDLPLDDIPPPPYAPRSTPA